MGESDARSETVNKGKTEMSKLFGWLATAASLVAMSASVYAAPLPVPEIDSGSAAIAVGLLAGIVALIRERW